MTTIDIVAALVSALLHAGWNAAVKAGPRPDEAMGAQMMSSALLVLPILAVTGLPPLAAMPWIAASMIMNTAIVPRPHTFQRALPGPAGGGGIACSAP